MTDSLEREKLLEAIVFFASKAKHVGVVKLFKLLYFLDMLHFRETGRSVTGLQYKALPYGPVPTQLYDELDNPPDDLRKVIAVQPKMVERDQEVVPRGSIIKPLAAVDLAYLTKREKRILNEVAEIFYDVTADQISDISHARNGPWDLARKRGEGRWKVPIDYLDSLNLAMGTGVPATKAELEDRAADHAEIQKHFA